MVLVYFLLVKVVIWREPRSCQRVSAFDSGGSAEDFEGTEQPARMSIFEWR